MMVSAPITGTQEQNDFDGLTAVVEQQREQANGSYDKPERITSHVVTEPTAKAYTEPVILPQYYLCRAFDKNDAKSGIPFHDDACCEGCGNYILYGHYIYTYILSKVLPSFSLPGFTL